METDSKDRKWIVVRIDGKIAAVSTDYRMLASISAQLAKAYPGSRMPKDRTGDERSGHKGSASAECPYGEITAKCASFDEIWRLRKEVGWNDLMLFGTDFQKRVWKKLWDMKGEGTAHLISYSDFADLCQNRAGVRAVAHAIGLNPISVIIPCHLVVPKESIDKIKDINRKAEATIFKGQDLCLESILKDESIDFGGYALGRRLKRELIRLELSDGSF